MPEPLENRRHELFAQGIAIGKPIDEAYFEAGYNGKTVASARTAASVLLARADIQDRIDEIRRTAATMAEIKAADVVKELARSACFDPRRVVRWTDAQTEIYEATADDLGPEAVAALEEEVLAGKVQRGPDGVYRRKVVISPGVWLVNSDEIGPDVAAVIAEVSQGAHGVRVKFHNKMQALEMLGKYLQMWTDAAAAQGKPFAITDKPLSSDEWIRQFTDTDGKTQH